MKEMSPSTSPLDLLAEFDDRSDVVIFPNNAEGEFVASFFAYYGAGGKGYCDGVEFALAFTDTGYEQTFGSDIPRLDKVMFHNNPDTDITAFGSFRDEPVELSLEQQQKLSELMVNHIEDALIVQASTATGN